MSKFKEIAGKLTVLGVLPLVVAACGGGPEASFSRDVKPILEQNCVRCHRAGGAGEVASGLNMETYDKLMKGTRNGPMVIAGDVEGSNLVVLMEGRADPSIRMPHGQKKPMASKDIEIIRRWIEQGARNN